jgi:FixJ family two-component response regulator
MVTTTCALVCVVDDDESVRESLPHLLRELGYAVRAYSSAEQFLASGCLDETSCLILDVFLQGMRGPELMKQLIGAGVSVPIVFITAHVDEDFRSQLLREGAVECLFKPFSERDLIAALHAALHVRRLN